MRKTNNLQKFYRESEQRYKDKRLDFDPNDLHRMIDNLYQQSKRNYLKLSDPKTCNSVVYTDVFIWQEIGDDIARKGVGKPFRLDNPPAEYKASADFLNNYPQELILEIKKNEEMRNQFDFNKMREKWLATVVERNNFSLNKGYASRLNMYLRNFKIPESEYDKFLKNVDKVIFDCNQKLTSLPKPNSLELSKYCFICELEPFPFKNTSEILAFFKKEYPILRENINRIKISMADCSGAKYMKESDSFEITLDKNVKTNHQKLDLIHELAHVVLNLGYFKKGKNIKKKGRYFGEKSAIKIELMLLKKYSPQLFVAKLGSILHNIWKTLFEIEIYQNPNRNPDKLYAECFNRCFAGANQKINRDYLLNLDILYQNFSLLPYVVAYTNILRDIL